MNEEILSRPQPTAEQLLAIANNDDVTKSKAATEDVTGEQHREPELLDND